MFLFGDFYENSLPPFSLNAVSSRNAVPNNGSGACVLVFVLLMLMDGRKVMLLISFKMDILLSYLLAPIISLV